MKYALKTQRLTTSQKLSDRFLACQVHSPSEEAKDGGTGYIFSLVEILNPWFPTPQIGQTIINTVAREYYRSTELEPLDKFENSLKKTNENLTHFTQNGQTDWIGNLHAIIALIDKQQLFITAVGRPYVLLLREGRFIDLTKELASSNDEIHPLRTFANITNGELKQGDIIILASTEIWNYLPEHELKPIIELNSLPEAAVEISNRVRQKGTANLSVIIIEVTTPEDVENEPVSDIPDTIYLDEVNEKLLVRTNLFLRLHLLPQLKKAGKVILIPVQPIKSWLGKRNLSTVKNTLSKTGQGLKNVTASSGQFVQKFRPNRPDQPEAPDESSPPDDFYPEEELDNKQDLAVEPDNFDSPELEQDDQPSQMEKFNASPNEDREFNGYYRSDQHDKDLKTINSNMPPLVGASYHVRHYHDGGFFQRLKRTLGNFGQNLPQLMSSLGQLFTDPKRRPKLYRYLIVLLIVILSISLAVKISHLRHNQSASPDTTYQLSDLKSKYNTALVSEPSDAIPLLQAIVTTVNSIKSPGQDYVTLLKEANDRLAVLIRSVSLTVPSSAIKLPKDAGNLQNIFLINKNIYAIDVNGAIFSASQSANTIESIAHLPSDSGTVVSSAGPTSQGSILIFTSKQNMYEFLPSKTIVQPVQTSANNIWKSSSIISIYVSNIYLLDSTGIVWKYVLSGSKYGQPTKYSTNSKAVFPNARSLGIDGNLFILDNNGTPYELNKNSLTQITLTGFPTDSQKPRSPKQIFTSPNDNYIYFIENNRLISFSKSGVYNKEYLLPTSAGTIKSINSDTKLQKLWIATNNSIFSASF